MTKNKEIRVLGQNHGLVNTIEQLIQLLESMGAFFHKSLRINETQNEISVRFDSDSDKNELLIDLPMQCIPLVEDYKFSLNDDMQLIARLKKEAINPEAHEVMNLLVKQYNDSNKIADWKQTYPLFALAKHPQLLEHIFTAKTNTECYQNYANGNIGDIDNQALIRSFFDSRVMDFHRPSFLRAGKTLTKSSMQGFIPIIELMNHKMGIPGYNINTLKNSVQTLASPGKANREVFVQYNEYDPLITFLRYGFIDTFSSWIYSVPIHIKLSNGSDFYLANILGTAEKKSLPDKLKSSAEYVPEKIYVSSEGALASMLIIPKPENFDSLRIILSHILDMLNTHAGTKKSQLPAKEIEYVIHQLLSKNLIYWEKLKALVTTYHNSETLLEGSVRSQLLVLSDFYINHIKQCVNYFNLHAS